MQVKKANEEKEAAPGAKYRYNVLVRDTTGNTAAYTQLSITLPNT